jgi:hypothetical protein
VVVVLVVVRQRVGAERRPADKAQAPAVLPRAAGATALPRAAVKEAGAQPALARAAASALQPGVAPAVSQASQQQAAVRKGEAQPRAAASASKPGVSQVSQQQAATWSVWPAWPRLAQRQLQAMAVWPVLLLLQAPPTALPATASLAALDPAPAMAPAVSRVLQLLRVPAKALLSACRSVTARAAGLALPAGASRAAPPDPASAPVCRACRRRVQTDFAA